MTLGMAAPRRAPLGCAQLTPVAVYQANSGSGGALAGAIVGGEQGRSRWSRILRTTSPSVIIAISLRAPPQSGQVRTSTANTRRRSSAQRSLWVLAGLACAAGESFEPATGPEQAVLHSGGPWCGSVRARGPVTMRSRHCAAGASRPW